MKRRDGVWQWVLGAMLLVAFWGLLGTPYDPAEQAFRERAYEGPSLAHPLGVDASGRDFLSRVWAGVGHTSMMGLVAMVVALLVAGLLLALERAFPRSVTPVLQPLIGIWVAMPVVLVSLVLLVFLRPSPATLVIAAAAGAVPLAFRQLRVLWLEEAQATYVQASIVLGAGPWDRFWHSILPNLMPGVAALAKLVFAIAVLELSGLAFLGLLGDPDFPELGALMRQNQPYLFRAPHLVLIPGVCLTGVLFLVHVSRTSRQRL